MPDELIQEWRDRKDKMIRKLFKDQNLELDEEKHKEILDEDVAKIRRILENGLDIGTIVRHITPAKLVEYKGEIYFKIKKGELFRVSKYLR